MKFKIVHNKEDAKGLFTEIVGEIAKPLRGYSEERIFYVYAHKRPTDGSVFYIGKGKKRRAWNSKSRNNHWKNIVEKYGSFDVEILHNNLSEQEAFNLEREEVLRIGMENLTNQTLGGISTTGFRHDEETKKLFSKISTDRLVNTPGLLESITERLYVLHDKQRNDPKYRKEMSRKSSEYYASLTHEEMALHAHKTSAWTADAAKLEAAEQKMREYHNRPEVLERNSERMKARWANTTVEERTVISKRSSENIRRPRIQEMLAEILSEKIVVNRKFVFKSIQDFLVATDSTYTTLYNSRKASAKHGFDFAVTKGHFVESYCESKHSRTPEYSGEIIGKLDFDCLPRSKAVVANDRVVFLSMAEASKFCNGKTISATADFITKNIKRGKTAFGYSWRVATTDEIQTEILNRLERFNNE